MQHIEIRIYKQSEYVYIDKFKMSQGFRKGNKRPEFSETTGITPPTRIDQNRNTRRTQQINHLHQQFQDLKQKIKEVENKNEKIIEKIHKAYNFKKKSTFTEGHLGQRDTSPVIHYENRYDPIYSASVDGQSNKSGHSSKAPKMHKKTTDFSKAGREKYHLKNQRFNQSMEYRTDPYIHEEGESNFNPPIASYTTTEQLRGQNTSPISYGSVSAPKIPRQTSEKMQKKLFEQICLEKQNLEQDLIERDNEVYRLQSQLKGVVKNAKNLFEGQLDDFVENFIQRNMSEIERTLKKYEQKLRNVKKLAIVVKDKYEDKKSARILEVGRNRRSRSRSRRGSPQRDSILSKDGKESVLRESREFKDQTKSRSKIIDQQQKNQKEFKEIADRYEEQIRGKIQEIEKWEKKFRLKERECYELKMRVDILQKRLSEEQKKSSKNESFVAGSISEVGITKKYSTDSDLLAQIGENQIMREKEDLQKQIAKFESKVLELENQKSQSQIRIESLSQKISNLENKNKNLHLEYQENLTKAKHKLREDQENSSKEFQILLGEKNDEVQKIKAQLNQMEKKVLERECQAFSLENKMKKMEGILSNKDKKIEELEKIAESHEERGLTSSRMSNSDFFERSIYTSSGGEGDVQKLKSEIERLELQLQEIRNQNFQVSKSLEFYRNKSEEEEEKSSSLKKQVEGLKIENEQLKIDANINNISVVEVGNSINSSDSIEELEGGEKSEKDEENEKVEEIRNKYEKKLEKLEKEKEEWYSKYMKIKNSGLEYESKCVKMQMELEFVLENSKANEELAEAMRSQNAVLKEENARFSQKMRGLEEKLAYEREENQKELNEIEKKWMQFEEERQKAGNNDFDYPDLKSSKSSLISYNLKGKIDHIHTENEFLMMKLKEAESEIETQKTMEKKIIDEYKSNMEESKKSLKLKDKQIECLREEIDDLHHKITDISLKIIPSGSGEKDNQRAQMMERIQELEAELKQTKEYTKRMTDMEEQLFQEIKIKEEETTELYAELKDKENRIKELQEMIELKETVQGPIFGSHISSTSKPRESLKSQSSLKYSSNTRGRIMKDSQRLLTSNAHTELFDLELSEAGESFYEQPSQISNISEIFEREEIPYEKMKIKRQEQVKLFEKTAIYIKSLKKAIDEKNKRIKILEKKIESIKSSELVRKEIGVDVKEETVIDDGETFRDYESVQLQNRRGQGGYFRRYKQLENDTKLLMEENNMLVHQIESFEQELLKAEEQQNSLVKIKDLYKEEIKKLIKKNEEQTKAFEEELRNERRRVEESESIHNIEAIKQLFKKIVEIMGERFTKGEAMPAKKKEEKRKQVEEYVKVMSNILKLDKGQKEHLLNVLHK